MRQEGQYWNKIRAVLEIVVNGAPKTGLSPKAFIFRKSDNHYWSPVSGWRPTLTDTVMNEAFPGLYMLAIPESDLEQEKGADGYLVKIVEPTRPLTEYVDIETYLDPTPDPSLIADSVWGADVRHYSDKDTFGLFARIVAGLTQYNHRITDSQYDESGRLMACRLVVYPSSEDAEGKTNALTTVEVTATYDEKQNMQTFLAKEEK